MSALVARATRPALVVGGLGLLLFVGVAVPRWPELAIVTTLVVLALGLTLLDPVMLPLLSVPLLIVSLRVGSGTVNLSLADLALAIAALPALLLGRRPFSPPMAWILVFSACYQFSTLFAVVAHPFSASIVEWFHAGVLVTGSMFVGWSLGRAGRGPIAINLLTASVLLVAIGTFTTGLENFQHGDFGPVFPRWPFPMHKNLAGPVLVVAATIAYVRPRWLGWSERRGKLLFGVFVLAALLTQSRQALVGLGVVLALFVIRSPVGHRRSRVVLVLVSGLLFLSFILLQDQLDSGNRFNSANQRLSWFTEAVGVWLKDPWLGQGLRWWVPIGGSQPPNAELEQLTSTGVIGLVGFIVLFLGSLLVLRRVDPAYALLPIMVIGCRIVQSQFDLFWVAVLGSIPWFIAALSLGQQAHDLEASAGPPAASRWPRPADQVTTRAAS